MKNEKVINRLINRLKEAEDNLIQAEKIEEECSYKKPYALHINMYCGCENTRENCVKVLNHKLAKAEFLKAQDDVKKYFGS